MSDRVAVVYPHHLFREHPALSETVHFVLVEDPLFFRQYRFHKQKLAFHRASMLEYQALLETLGKQVRYVRVSEIENTEDIFRFIPSQSNLLVAELDDDWLCQRVLSGASAHGVTVSQLPSPGFLLPRKLSDSLLPSRPPFLMANFYQRVRRHTGVLMDGSKPVGGRWSFDSENRKKWPKSLAAPKRYRSGGSKFSAHAVATIYRDFSNNPGNCDELLYPVTFEDADRALAHFLEHLLSSFGTYQDAIVEREPFLFHSVLSPLINAGLLTPRQVVAATLEFADEKNVPLNSLEGFLRQVIGWREFVRAAYHRVGRKQRTRNFWGHTRKLPVSFWNGTTGIVPVDAAIRRTLQFGYCHHIERLMVLGNFMLLCEFDPDDVYRWFMEMFVDSYDWVMVPNVYGMSQYGDGGLMTTKPYISSSNYIRKMSDSAPGEWCEIWDSLYWRFVERHRDFFLANPRLKVMALQFDKFDPGKRARYLKRGESFLNSLG